MSYEFKTDDVFEFARFLNAETRQKRNELEFKYCPKCSGGQHHDDWTFSINMDNGLFKCMRGSCEYQGHFVSLCRDFDYRLEYDTPKTYKKLPQPKQKIESKPEAIKYLESRGISAEICKLYEITVKKDDPKVLCFPFFDETGTLQFIKYRNTKFKKGDKGSKEWSESDAMPILFGIKQCKGTDTLVITEGQIDSLSVAEAFKDEFEDVDVVSVPIGKGNFGWLTQSWEWISKYKEIVVFGDYENGKISLLETLQNRLPMKVKAVRTKDYLKEKDANDILCKYGKKEVVKAVINAEPPMITNVKDLSAVRNIDINELEKIKTGLKDLDKVIGGMVLGQVILLSGRRGDGKSTFMSQLICSALQQGFNTFAYSGELTDFHFKRWVDYQLAGPDNLTSYVNEYGDTYYSIPNDVLDKINAWYRGRCFIYDNEYLPDKDDEYKSLIKTAEQVIRQYNVQFICIDNLMTAMDRVDRQDNLYLAQSNFVGDLKRLAIKYNVCIVLVAHPNKSSRDGKDFDNDFVSGSSDITNKVDVVLYYGRAKDEEIGDGVIEVCKNRLLGKLASRGNGIITYYSEASKRITGMNDKDVHYGWEKQNTDGTFVEIVDDDYDLPF